MYEKFINELKKTSYYNLIFNNHNVMMLYIGGSRLANCVDEKSDYDLVAIVSNEDCNEEPKEYLMYNGIKVHWYYRRISEFVEPVNGHIYGFFNGVIFNNMCPQKIIYENPKYVEIIEYLKNVRDIIGKISTYNLYANQKTFIKSILSSKNINKEHYVKKLYYLCYASYFILNELPNTEFLNAIKRIRWLPVSDEYKKIAIERLELLDAYVNQNLLDVSNIIENININLKYLIQKVE